MASFTYTIGAGIAIVAVGINLAAGVARLVIIVSTNASYTGLDRTGISVHAVVSCGAGRNALAAVNIASLFHVTISIALTNNRHHAIALIAVFTIGCRIAILTRHAVWLLM